MLPAPTQALDLLTLHAESVAATAVKPPEGIEVRKLSNGHAGHFTEVHIAPLFGRWTSQGPQLGCGEAIGLLQLTAQQTPLQLGAALGINTRRHQPALRVGGLQLGQLIWISDQQPQQTANSPVVGLPALAAQQFPNRLDQFGRLGRQAFPEPLTLAGIAFEELLQQCSRFNNGLLRTTRRSR